MKRAGHLMEAIAADDNLRMAFWKASKSKRAKADCRLFTENLDVELDELRGDLLAGDVAVGDYHYFTIHRQEQQHWIPPRPCPSSTGLSEEGCG